MVMGNVYVFLEKNIATFFIFVTQMINEHETFFIRKYPIKGNTIVKKGGYYKKYQTSFSVKELQRVKLKSSGYNGNSLYRTRTKNQNISFPHSPIDKHRLLIRYSSDQSLIDLSANSLKFDAVLAGSHMQEKINLKRIM